MRRNRTSWALRGIPLALAAAFAAPGLLVAQGGPGFLFRDPHGSIRLETGYGLQLANSDIFDFYHDELTVSRKDFDAPYLGAEIAARVGQRWDVAVGVGFSRSSKASEFRDWVDNNENPIEQVTALRTVPVTLSAKYYLAERGRSVGRFAWVPNTVTPYVGAGVGVVSYRFEQTGDFVDFASLDIFYDQYVSTGQAALLRGLAGVSVSLGGQFELTGEARYQHAQGELGNRFDEFDDSLDLSGVQGVIGIAIRF
jgi:hypothetical protein